MRDVGGLDAQVRRGSSGARAGRSGAAACPAQTGPRADGWTPHDPAHARCYAAALGVRQARLAQERLGSQLWRGLCLTGSPHGVVSLRARPPAVASSKGGTRACSALMTVASCPLSCAAQAGLQGVAGVGAGVDWFDLSVCEGWAGLSLPWVHLCPPPPLSCMGLLSGAACWVLANLVRRRHRQSIHPML